MTEELHEITYRQQVTESYTRAQIEKIAKNDTPYPIRLVEACREWVEANPRGLTREEFDALPDGTRLRTDSNQWVKFDGDLYAKAGPNIENLDTLTVVSTPPPPSLEDVDVVRDKNDDIWELLGYGIWCSSDDGAEMNTAELLNRYGPITPLIPGPQIGGEA